MSALRYRLAQRKFSGDPFEKKNNLRADIIAGQNPMSVKIGANGFRTYQLGPKPQNCWAILWFWACMDYVRHGKIQGQ